MDGIILQLLGVKLDIIVSVGSVLALIGLIIIYAKNYKAFKTKFSLALLLFVSLFFIDEIIYAISLLLNPGISTSLQTFVNVIEFISFLILLIVARE
jgi:hypothetical protein